VSSNSGATPSICWYTQLGRHFNDLARWKSGMLDWGSKPFAHSTEMTRGNYGIYGEGEASQPPREGITFVTCPRDNCECRACRSGHGQRVRAMGSLPQTWLVLFPDIAEDKTGRVIGMEEAFIRRRVKPSVPENHLDSLKVCAEWVVFRPREVIAIIGRTRRRNQSTTTDRSK
jgi:hypothetical protein